MGFEKSIFFEDVPLEYICMHCQEVLEKAEAAPCGHILCTACFIKRGRKRMFCPLCAQPQTPLEQSKFVKLPEVDEQISKLTTWCNFKDCHEHVPLCQRDNHLKECLRRNNIKKKIIQSDHADIEAGEESDENVVERGKKKKRMLYRIGASLCLYAVFATIGLPGDHILDGIQWCGVEDFNHFMSGI
jgi:hypothetical protein